MSLTKKRPHNMGLIKKLKGLAKFAHLNGKRKMGDPIDRKNINIDLEEYLADFKNFKNLHHGIRYAHKYDLLHNGSFHEAIGPVLVIAQCFCLMPVRGIRSHSAKGLNFRWLSFRTAYCLVYMLSTIVDTLLTLNMVRYKKLDVRNIEPLVFHITILFASIGFLRLASKWPKLMRSWQQVEKQLPAFRSWQEREELAKRIKTVTFVLITVSLTQSMHCDLEGFEKFTHYRFFFFLLVFATAEHLLSTISAIHFANYCPATKDPIESYFLNVVSQIFFIFDYSPWLAWLGKIQNVLMTFGWTYMDVFVLIIGIGLSSMLKRVGHHLESYVGQPMPESHWREARRQYMLICDLIEEVDEAVSGITMLSFANNLYFVCIQCLKSINTMPSVAHAIYFYFSLLFLLARTLTVCLYLAEVNDRSRTPLNILKQVPDKAYNLEVERFTLEISSMTVAMTGMQYFDITRKLVLTVAGTIVTYELVLIQFQEDQKLWNCDND